MPGASQQNVHYSDRLLGLRNRLPEPQVAALEGALALAPAAPGDRFTVCVAALGLLRTTGRVPLPAPLPAGERVAAVFAHRIGALPAAVQDVLLLAAAADGGELRMLERACAGACR